MVGTSGKQKESGKLKVSAWNPVNTISGIRKGKKLPPPLLP